MSDKVKIFALGGLDENGKSMYVVEINDDIFIFEAGLKYPDKTRPGIDFVIPNIDYLKNNRQRVKAYIISHGHDDQFGALPFIYNEVPAPIYGSEATIMMLEKFTQRVGSEQKYQTVIVEPSSEVKIANRVFRFFQTTHNMMSSFGTAVYTDQGYIVYTGDFIVEYNESNRYKLDLKALARIAEKDVLCLMSESIASEKTGYASPHHRLQPHLENTLREAKGRIFISLYEQSTYTIEELVTLAVGANRKVSFYDKDTEDYINMFAQHKLNLIDPKNIVSREDILRTKDSDLVILMLGNGEDIFQKIIKLGNKTNENKQIILTSSDTFVLACPPPVILEVIATEALDTLYYSGANIVDLNNRLVGNMHAQEEDLKMILALLKPKYYLPIKGMYRHQIANAKIALHSALKYTHSNILLVDNGVPVTFENGVSKISYSELDKIVNGDVMVDGTGIGDINRGVIEDRQKLSADGMIVMGVGYSPLTRKIVVGPDVQMRGFVYLKDSELLLKTIIKILIEEVNAGLVKQVIRPDEIAEQVQMKVEKYILRETRRRPMIIPIVHEI